jgi:hypothetical protein
MLHALPCVVCIDVEPDARCLTSASDEWWGAAATWECLSELRPDLARATGAPARFAWFWRTDSQVAQVYGSAVWGLERHRQLLRLLRHAGDEIGIHIHLWRRGTEGDGWLADYSDPAWAELCIRDAVAAFAPRLGPPSSSRLGDRWLSNGAVSTLEALGLKHDLTLEPGMPAAPAGAVGEVARGWLPGTSGAPRRPYRPAPSDYRRAGRRRARRLWMIPLSTAPAHDSRRVREAPQAATGAWIAARPNPLWLEMGKGYGTVEIVWHATTARHAEVRVDAHDGPLLARGGERGWARTGDWVRDAMDFWLVACDREPPAALAVTTVRVLEADVPLACPAPASAAAARTLYLSLESTLFRSLVDSVLRDPQTRHLAVVARSDYCLDPALRSHIVSNLGYLAGGPGGRRLQFLTPQELVVRAAAGAPFLTPAATGRAPSQR